MVKWLSIPVLVVLVALSVLGCSAPAPAPAATPASAGPAKPSGDLKIAVGLLATQNLDPSLNSTAGRLYTDLMYDRLVGYTPSGELSKANGIASDWTVSPDGMQLTFKLRPGVKFHNGDEVTSADVKFSLEHFMRPAGVSTGVATLRNAVKSIETPDSSTVVINTKARQPFLAWDLSGVMGNEGMVLPSKYIKEKGEEYFLHNPIGTGPYRFKEQVMGSHIELEAVPEHWRIGVPKYEKVRFSLVSEEGTRIAMLKRGEADIIDMSRDRLSEVAEFKTAAEEGGVIVYMFFHNVWEGPLKDVKVREALNLAINREEIKDFLYRGQAKAVGSARYGSWAVGYKPVTPYAYDLDRAKKLLAEASPQGVSLTMYSHDRPPEGPQLIEAVASMWRKAGVDAKILPVDYATWRTKAQNAETTNVIATMSTTNTPMWHGLWDGSWSNRSPLKGLSFRNEQYDKMLADLVAEGDITKYGEKQYELAKWVRDNHLAIPLVETGSLYAFNPKKVSDWKMARNVWDINLEAVIKR